VAKASGVSMSQLAYDQLRNEILTGALTAEAKINIAETVGRTGLNLGAVREALSRLASEGLVTSETNKGFRVAPITMDELEDLTRTRVMIESACLENAIQNGDIQWEGQVLSACHALLRTPMLTPDTQRVNPAWTEQHAAFHAALVAGCDSPWLLRLRGMLYVQAERYRIATMPYDRASRNLDAEHQALAAAAVARDGQQATALMRDHLLKTRRILVEAGLVAPRPA
jgi:GntR family transcriptional regulator, carbon starvation induced regulator